MTAYGGAIPDKAVMDKDTFADSINPYLNYFNDTFVPEATALQLDVSSNEASAVSAAAAAVAAANFKGTWTNELTAIGESWEYSGVIYGVLVAGTDSPATTPSNWFALTIAQAIKNTPAGNISATTVQTAINELDTEKAPKASPALTGSPTLDGNLLQTKNFRNRFINGDMAINQINGSTSVTVTAGAALNYVTDQWYAYCTGANVTTQRVAGSLQSQYRQQFTGAASVTKIGFAQRMEAGFTYDMNDKSAMIGVDMSNSLLTSVTWTAWYANTADTFGTLASPTRTQIATGTITVSSTLGRYFIPVTIPSAATTGIEIEFSVGAQISGTWVIGNAQFEKVPTGATTGTDFEVIPPDISLTRCTRLLPSAGNTGSNAYLGQCLNSSQAYITIPFKTISRISPSSILIIGTIGDMTLTNSGGGSITVTGVSIVIAGDSSCVISIGVSTGLVAGQATVLNMNGVKILFDGARL